ncbi:MULTISPECIES: hypothetical protein [unclassified Bradyrhizobium]|uniref:hypothetical protein n=1 Tax=unclassified Bradyrhizobium TaxID=2631580 RepID=UPI001FF9D8EE|nr:MULTISPECIES: hypothetical protein [unclassified Bradyrhizobium]
MLLLVKFEPRPLTVTVPLLPAAPPMTVLMVETVPPLLIASVPVPFWPTPRLPPELFHFEPAPLTVTVPLPVAERPRCAALGVVSVLPFWIVSLPVPVLPTTVNPEAPVEGPETPSTVAFGLVVLMVTELVAVGTALVDQLVLVVQSVLVAPVQVCAAAVPIDSSAVTAVQVKLAGPTTPREARMADMALHLPRVISETAVQVP